MDIIHFRIFSNLSQETVEGGRLPMPNGMGDGVAAEAVCGVVHEGETAGWEKVDAFSEDGGALGEARVDYRGDVGEGGDVAGEKGAPC
jgi:hypothetical protein